MPEIYQTLLQDVTDFGLRLLYAIIIVAAGLQLVKLFSRWLMHSRIAKRIDPSVHSFLSTSLTLALRVAVFIAAALTLGVPGSAFITAFGSAGLAIGLALQGSLSNLAGGLMLLFFRPFSVGDYIKTATNEGTVTQISAFYTTIRTDDCKRIVLPNGSLTNAPLMNYSAEQLRLLDLPFSVAYDADPERVRNLLLAQAIANPHVLSDPAPSAPMTKLTATVAVFNLRVWVAQEHYKSVEADLLENTKRAIDAEGLHIL